MNACIVTIGNELLNGHTEDTNSRWLCERLLEIGIAVRGGWIVPDENKRIVQSLRQATQCAELILVTGGLGPTDDDITRQAVANYLEVPLEFREELLKHLNMFFARLGRPMAQKNLSQTYVPQGTQILHNPKGTAAGFWFERSQLKIAVMPGVPAEMRCMFESHVLPRIKKTRTGSVVVNAKLRCFGLGESEIAQKLDSRMERGRNPLVNSTCGEGDIVLHISATAQSQAEAMAMIEQEKRVLTELLGDYIYGCDEQSLSEVVGDLLRKKKQTIAIAESCTGGLLSEMLTDVPDASEYLLAGWVTYSNASKVSQLGIPEQVIAAHGAVSEAVARAMAFGAAAQSGADIAIGITGIAGPSGGTNEKPVGLVFISLYYAGQTNVYKYCFPPVNRQSVRLRTALNALNLLRLQLRI